MIRTINCRPWTSNTAPKRILAIRFQALGDTIITLPYLQNLKRQHPSIQLDLLTRKEVNQVPENISLFNNVISIGGGRNAKLQFILALLKLPYLLGRKYDVVLDLQNNKISIALRKLLNPKSWSEFDKFSSRSAGLRTQLTIEAVGIGTSSPDPDFHIDFDPAQLLLENGWDGQSTLVVLNPAGFSPSRNWPIENYIAFAKCWTESVDAKSQFVLLLLPSLREKAECIAKALGNKCIDLTGKAHQVAAFAVVKQSKFVLSEDSGLMHMAWVQGVPTIALFSSSRKDWSAPLGDKSFCFDSSDMECGPCGLLECKYGDNRCLTRIQPQTVITKAKDILKITLPAR